MDKGLDIDGRRRLLACHAVLGSLAADAAGRSPAGAAPAAALAAALAHVRATRRRPDFDAAARALAWAAESPARRILVLGDADYPPRLAAIARPPLVLFVEGRMELLGSDQVAIVGSRKATSHGLRIASEFAGDLAAAGLTVTSGLALGIDAAAHEGALAVAGATLAVVGCGIDRVYPARHRRLAGAIRSTGAIVSEFALGTPPARRHFPQRNRLIAGLSLGTLVVEAAARSGSLSTAFHALEQGREVFAVPGSIRNPQAQGCHILIKQGAKLTERVEDVLEELPGGHTRAPPTAPVSRDHAPGDALDPAAARVLEACGWHPTSLEEIVGRCGLTLPDVSSILLQLELAGRVDFRTNGTYMRTR
ncbi:MAG: DNA-processing protein DprA [Gammaproteobacteria bacterium]